MALSSLLLPSLLTLTSYFTYKKSSLKSASRLRATLYKAYETTYVSPLMTWQDYVLQTYAILNNEFIISASVDTKKNIGNTDRYREQDSVTWDSFKYEINHARDSFEPRGSHWLFKIK